MENLNSINDLLPVCASLHSRHIQEEQQRDTASQILHEAQDSVTGLAGEDLSHSGLLFAHTVYFFLIIIIHWFCFVPLSLTRPVRSSAWPRGTTRCPLRSWPSLPSSRWKPASPTGGPNTSAWRRNSGRTTWTWPGASRPTWPCSYLQGPGHMAGKVLIAKIQHFSTESFNDWSFTSFLSGSRMTQ